MSPDEVSAMTEPRIILCINSGSSSLKFALFSVDDKSETRLAEGAAKRIGLSEGRFWIRNVCTGQVQEQQWQLGSPADAVAAVFESPELQQLPRPQMIGHRLVHGGLEHVSPERVTPQLIAGLQKLVPLAPLHLPAQIEVMEFVSQAHAALPQVACFDTAFHRSMPEIAQRLPLPRRCWDTGLRRFGFHGLSYEYVLKQLTTAPANAAIIIAHLGNGSSLAAVRDGKPVDTTMGLTPSGGLMMGTRSGDLDPGVLLYLLNEKHCSPAELASLVEQEAGLLGVSGLSSDMQELLEAEPTHPQAAQAIDMYCYLARKQIGGLAAALGGLDILVFTGGIGEHSAPIRARICQELGFLGIQLDTRQNALHADLISSPGSACTVRVVATDEERMIARHTYDLLCYD